MNSVVSMNAMRLSRVFQREQLIHPLPSCSMCIYRTFSAKPDEDASQSALSPIQTSLALSVHFLHPKLGMKDYEILSRATAFLLNVDPFDEAPLDSIVETLSDASTTTSTGRQIKSAFPHLATNKAQREASALKQDYAYNPASGPKRHAHQLNWLEFCPTSFRPKVHVVASSHVLSPWRWPQYYGQEWLKEVNEEHVKYSLEVYGHNIDKDGMDGGQEGKLSGTFGPVAKFALNPYPIHHPNGLDVAVIHLKGEDEALEHLKKMRVQPLNLHTIHELEKSTDPVFEPGDEVHFHGFEVYEANKVDDEILSPKDLNSQDDERIFHPYYASGIQTFGSPDRFLAKTSNPLPEGLCGGPVLTTQHNRKQPLFLRGVVEGIVPTNHENAELAGAASFLPAYRVREFVDFAERIMLEQIIEPELFKRVVDIKENHERQSKATVMGQDQTENSNSKDDVIKDPNMLSGMEGISTEDDDTPNIDSRYQEIVASLHKHHAPKEVDAILATVEREQKEVLEILEKEGGDMDDIIAQVRKRTYEERDRVLKELGDKIERDSDGVIEGEIVSKENKPK